MKDDTEAPISADLPAENSSGPERRRTPPAGRRFQAGQSGNPSGRPRGQTPPAHVLALQAVLDGVRLSDLQRQQILEGFETRTRARARQP